MSLKKSYKEQKTEAERGKKRYLERLAETRDANKEIEDFVNEDSEHGSDINRPLRDRPLGS
jgi:hypothetical protein